MKRNFILTIIACGASLALCPGIYAQDASPSTTGTDSGQHPWGHHGGGDMLERLTKALDLTPEEVTQIKPILETQRTQMQAIRADTTLTQQDKMAKAKDVHEATTTQINAILTPEQQAKYAEMQQKMHNHRHGGGPGGADQAAPSPAASATP
jgi:Spy/CpxP family protein refolding chaperone